MIKFIRKNYKKHFHYIPVKLPVVISLMMIICLGAYLLFGDAGGFFSNLITELFGIVVTVYIVSYLLLKKERENWGSVEKILQDKLDSFILSFYFSLSHSLNINVIEEFGSTTNLIKGSNRVKLKKLLEENVNSSINNFLGKDLDEFVDELTKQKKHLLEIIHYMEKRPVFLQNLELFEIENKLDNIINGNLFNHLFCGVKDDMLIRETNHNVSNGLITDIKNILEKIDNISKKNKKNKIK